MSVAVGSRLLIPDVVRCNTPLNSITVLLQIDGALLALIRVHYDASNSARHGVFPDICLLQLWGVAQAEVRPYVKLFTDFQTRRAKQNGKTPSSQFGLLIGDSIGRRENEGVGSTSNPLQVQFRNRAWLKLVIPRRR